MKIRILSGIVYVLIQAVFYCLKIFVHDWCFDVWIYFLSLVGTYEILRATKEKTTKMERYIVRMFSVLCVPACAIAEYYYKYGLHMVCVCFFALVVLLLIQLVIDHEETSLENVGVSLLSAVYPIFLLCLFVLSNHVRVPDALVEIGFNSDLLVLMILVISPCSDSVAYIFGLCLHKVFPRKLAPTVSPNKTIVGAIGGLIGGVLSALALYFVYNSVAGSFVDMHIWLPVYLFIGFLVSLATEFGDLVESCIKRKVNVKDMGKIMPGHGGCLDRIDGTMFATIAAYIVFMVIYLMFI